MSVKQEANGRRSVQVEFEVPGTPEEVWQAIATGPGISSWFVPAEFEERDGKPVAVKFNFGPGMEIRACRDGVGSAADVCRGGRRHTVARRPSRPSGALKRARAGCAVVRIVHSLFASTDEWDNQLEGAKSGWAGFLNILRIYLTHFRGQRSAIMQVTAPVAGTEAEAWETLTAALGVKGLSVGQRWTTPAGVSPLGGVVEFLTEDPYDALLRLDKPGPGIAALGAVTYPGGQSVVAMNLYLYGDQAAATVARETPLWQAWFQERFPMPTELSKSE